MFKVNNKDSRTTPIVNFEQVNADWIGTDLLLL